MEIFEDGDQLGFPYWTSVPRRFQPDSPFFATGNIEREIIAKQVALDLDDEEKDQLLFMEDDAGRNMVCCPIVGCGSRLKSLENFEDHYNARHTASCSVCSRVYPTSRLLNIHVSEAHDSFFQAKVARGFAMYECLVEGCGLKFKSYKDRKQHLVDKHRFPASFEFLKKAAGRHRPSRNHRQKSRLRQQPVVVAKKEEGSMEVDEEDVGIDSLISGVSRLSTGGETPPSVCFGRRHARGLPFVPRVLRPKR